MNTMNHQQHRAIQLRRNAYSGYGVALTFMTLFLLGHAIPQKSYPQVKGLQVSTICIIPATSIKIIDDFTGGRNGGKERVDVAQTSSGKTFTIHEPITEEKEVYFTVDVPTSDDPVGTDGGQNVDGNDSGSGPIADHSRHDGVGPKVSLPDDEFVTVTNEPSFDEQALRDAIVYPEIARRNGIEGTVLVKALVGVDGRVVNAIVLESENSILEQAALNSIRNIHFKPADIGGQKIACHVFVPIVFRLKR